MEILTAAIGSVSDVILFFAEIIILSLISGKQAIRSRLYVSAGIAFLGGALFDLLYTEVSLPFQLLLLIADSFTLCLLALFSLNSHRMIDAMLLMIIQFMCGSLNSAVCALIPDGYRFAELAPMLFISLVVLAVSLLLRRRLKSRPVLINGVAAIIPTYIYLLIIFVIFNERMLIEALSFTPNDVYYEVNTVKVLLLSLIAGISALIISLTVNVAYQKHYGHINKVLRDQVDIQLRHFKKREKLDTEIRRFRHDYLNHIKCLTAMLEAERYTEAKEYLEKISGIAPTGELLFKTGNYVADALLTEKQEAAAAEGIVVSFGGYIPDSIDSYDLCIILSNALDNAVEACMKLSDKERKITVYGNFQQGIFVLIVKNPVENMPDAKDIIPATTKEDKLYHGFGLSNIRSVVSKYDGSMHTQSENGEFILSLAFNKIEDDEKND